MREDSSRPLRQRRATWRGKDQPKVDLFRWLSGKDQNYRDEILAYGEKQQLIVVLFQLHAEKDQPKVDLFRPETFLEAISVYLWFVGTPKKPWDSLFRVAVAQEGLFSAAQAKEAGCSQQLLGRYLATGKVERVQRAIYRIVHFPKGENEDLVALWLWSKNEGVFSHETALFLHQLSDALPTRAHMTLPKVWARREVKLPQRLVVFYDEILDQDRAWHGPVPITAVRRTLVDCLNANVSAELVAQASAQAAERGLIAPAEVLTAPKIGLVRHRAHS